jgi:hypothetical protein
MQEKQASPKHRTVRAGAQEEEARARAPKAVIRLRSCGCHLPDPAIGNRDGPAISGELRQSAAIA